METKPVWHITIHSPLKDAAPLYRVDYQVMEEPGPTLTLEGGRGFRTLDEAIQFVREFAAKQEAK